MPAEPKTAATPLRVGLVGYGAGGRYFHAPFIAAARDIEIAGVVTRSPARRIQLAADLPGVPAWDDLAEAIDAGVDVVVITTPPETRRELVLAAVAAGVAVVADKPFAPDAAVARELRDAAAAGGVPLAVFHNRRWDADIRTLQSVLDSGRLGAISRFESRFDLDEPDSLEATPGGGLLRDLGSHVVDQALWLFGPATHVYAELDWVELPAGRVDAGFVIALTHESGVRSLVSATKINRASQRELRLYGALGSYRSDGTDVQAQAIFAGRRPLDDPAGWGYENPTRWGAISTASGVEPVPSARGAYQDYYSQLAVALRGDGPLPVTADEGVATVAVLDAARQSDAEHAVVRLP